MAKVATKLEFLVAKLKVVLALATVSVAISSPVGETSITHWEASVKANVASWFIMIMCHIHRKKKLSLLAQLQIHETNG